MRQLLEINTYEKQGGELGLEGIGGEIMQAWRNLHPPGEPWNQCFPKELIKSGLGIWVFINIFS